MNLKEIVGSIKSNVFVLLLALLIACSSYASALPELPWTVSIAVPTLYPAKVTEAYGVNEEQDWTSLLHNFSQFMRISDFKNISPRFPEYEGFGLPIADYAMNQKRQISPIKLPPDTLYLYWVSLLNTQFYVTKYEVPMGWKQMTIEIVPYWLRLKKDLRLKELPLILFHGAN
ncbi:DUF2931 family protein [Vibrio furnissii]|uniref:DUF2931 family protein n=1 Tax=Vibrio furnissii TaxID=29494 RepID=UPI003CC7EC5E